MTDFSWAGEYKDKMFYTPSPGATLRMYCAEENCSNDIYLKSKRYFIQALEEGRDYDYTRCFEHGKGKKVLPGYLDSLPKGKHRCSSCKRTLNVTSFNKSVRGKSGLDCLCKTCRKGLTVVRTPVSQELYLWRSARTRAKKNNMVFDIKVEDLVIPKTCPVFKVAMVPLGPYAPSIDRINSSEGYVKDNIQVISRRANILKNDATFEEIQALHEFMKEKEK